MPDTFDPYYHWLGIPPEEQPPDCYRLLGLRRFEEHPDVIQAAADRQMGHLRTYQSGPRSNESQRLLNEVAAAKVTLLHPEKKAAYDARLRSEMAETPAAAGEVDQAADGTLLGEYVLLDQLDRDGSGQMFKARHRTLGRKVAIKILSREAMQSPDRVARFRRKVKILAGLEHPNLVTAHDAGQCEGLHYLVMEYVAGTDLRKLLKKQGPLPVGQTLDYLRQAAAGLGYAHSRGVIHRNVKPSNLMVDLNGRVKVIGLGLARLDAGLAPGGEEFEEDLTQSGQVMGTSDYMSPEQTFDTHNVDHRTDVYSLGCTMYVLLTGRPPYPEKNPMKKILAHRKAPIPSLFESRPDVPLPLDALFRRMLAKQPEDRPRSMDEVAAALVAE